MALAEVIKYEGDNSTFIWKHPSEDFNTLSQLIVHESQEAIFFLNGQLADVFGPGRYTLETQNIPVLGKLLNLATGGETPFHCEVYFVNKTVQMAIKWGTDSKVRYIDPDSGIPIELGASGSMDLMVEDGTKLLVKLIGTMNGIAWDSSSSNFTKSLQDCFRPLISTSVKANLSTVIKSNNINIMEVDEHLDLISNAIHKRVEEGFQEYGLTIPHFYVTTVVLPEDDPNFKRVKELYTITLQTRMARAEATVKTAQAQAEADITAARRQIELEKQATATAVAQAQAERDLLEAQTKAQAAKMAGFAEAEVMAAKGYNQKDLIDADVQKAWAAGIGEMGSGGGSAGGGVASDMVSMMAGMKMAGTVLDKMDGLMGNSVSNTSQVHSAGAEKTTKCPKCGAVLPAGAKFCLECGEKVSVVPEGMVVCPNCGKTVPNGKFCLECGQPFVNKCPNCGAEIPAGSKFCLECGTKI